MSVLTGIFLVFLSRSLSLPLSLCLPSSLSPPLSVSWPSGQSICLFSLSDLSFTVTRAIQNHTAHSHTGCQAAGAAVCKHSSISHISSLQQQKQSKTPQHMHAHTLHIGLTTLAHVTMNNNTKLVLETSLLFPLMTRVSTHATNL